MAARLHHRAWQALRSVVHRRTVEQELDDELRFHFEQMAGHQTARGASAADAERLARRQFGGMNQVKEACRDMRTLRPLEHLLQDIRFGGRLLARSPVFTLVAVLSLALGIGANSAIFSVINAIVLRTLPVAAPGELRLAESSYRDETTQRFAYPLIERLTGALGDRAEVCAQSSVTPMQVATVADGRAARQPDPARVQLLSGGCFTLLRQRPQMGRLLGPEDTRTAAPAPVAVISDSFWSRTYARSPAAVGSELLLNGAAITIVGVTAPEFFGTAVESRGPDLWAPIPLQPTLRYAGNVSNSNGDTSKPWPAQRELSWLNVMLRVPPQEMGAVTDTFNAVVQQEAAQASGGASDQDLRERLRGTRVTLLDGARGFSAMRARVQTPLVVLLLMVGLVLAVACANLASLLLARASHRHREMAVRLSIGAGRGRLIRQLLTESLLLALLGGVGGLLAGAWGSAALVSLDGGQGISTVDVRPDWRVILFTIGVSLSTGILFGLLPAFRATRVSLSEAMKVHGRSVAGETKRGMSASRVLIAAQMACSLLLLVAAALFGRSLQHLMRADVGFDREHVLVASLDPQGGGYEPAELPELHRRVLERVGALPGVVSVSLSGNGPFSGSRTTSGFEAQGYAHSRDQRLRTQEEVVTPDYFRTVGLRILRGRGFEASDVSGGRLVSVINETMARRYFAGQDPVGRRWSYDLEFGPESFEIVGVVSDARYNDLKGDSLNMTYRPVAQSDWYPGSLEIKAAGDPAALIATLQSTLRQAEPRLPVARVETLDSRVARSMGQERMLTVLTGAFGLTALALACLGLYGTISYAVTRRTSELGVRMALGADRRSVRRLIMGEALSLVLLGLGIGLPLAFVAARSLQGILFGVTALDLPSYAGAVAVLLAIATLAAYFPARRASRLNPVAALRAE